jgi:hypothetical protein
MISGRGVGATGLRYHAQFEVVRRLRSEKIPLFPGEVAFRRGSEHRFRPLFPLWFRLTAAPIGNRNYTDITDMSIYFLSVSKVLI